MSHQGETGQAQQDDWWGRLYDGPDTDPPAAAAQSRGGDTLDERYASAVTALGDAPPETDAPPEDGRGDGYREGGEEGRGDGDGYRDGGEEGRGDGDGDGQGDVVEDVPVADRTLDLGVTPKAPPVAPPVEPPVEPPAREEPADRVETPDLPPGWIPAEPSPAAPTASAAAEPEVGVTYVGDRPPTYEPEPTAWPEADPDDPADLVPDTIVDGASYGRTTVRAVSVRGDSARYRGRPRREALLTARFGSGDDALLLLVVATGARASEEAHRAARDACRWIASAVGRSRDRLSEDLRAGRRGSLKSGLHRLTGRCLGRLRARGEDLGLHDGEYAADLRCLLLPADPACRTRLFFGTGDGGLFRLRDGDWEDLEPDGARQPEENPEDGDEGRFRFRASVARPGDLLLLCGAGLAQPLREEDRLAARLAARWGSGEPPGLAAFLADAQTRVKGYADDRTAVAVWDA